ncbi:S8 family serine peptidase [Actinoplanes sp. URMC 104]|uniref:S8 family serine peptidase n=1 Tax=Actinoplanes sp. URMC 104 TaxID=3423409 RepID=UPI003F19D7A9
MRKLLAGLIVGAALVPGAPARAAAADQWGLAQTRVDQAWSATRGSARTIVAVLDSGVSPLPDLAGRLLPGHDFVNHDDDPADDNGHGTMAATVIAAAGRNGKGVDGVCWSCRILPVKVLDAKGAGGYTGIALGIRYAADRGAAVISLSLGGSDDSPLLRDAVAYAESRGALVVAAAGNRGVSTPHYPAAIPSVVAVGGVTPAGTRYEWSNFGAWVDVTAPGCNQAQGPSGVVGPYCGTSSATPFVAGVAGLLASTDPAPSAAQVRTALLASRGRVDALTALRALPYDGDVTRPSVSLGPVRPLVRGRVTITAAASDQHGVSRVQLYAGGRLVATDTSAPYALGWQSAPRTGPVVLELRAYDRRGNLTVVRRTVRADNTAPALRLTRTGRTLTARAADPSGIARLELVVNGRVTARHAAATGRFTVPRARKVVVRAVDRAGNAKVADGKLVR